MVSHQPRRKALKVDASPDAALPENRATRGKSQTQASPCIEASFLLIAGENISPVWVDWLHEMLAPYGQLKIIAPAQTSALSGAWKGIFVDAGSGEDLARLTARLKEQNPSCRVIIVTAAPTSSEARAAFEAGASDYLGKNIDRRMLEERILHTLGYK